MIVAATVAECAQIVGVLLVFTLMVGPAAAAQRLITRIGFGIVLAGFLALLDGWGGIILAYWTDWPVSFWITGLSAAIYFLTLPRWSRSQSMPAADKIPIAKTI
jgi:zinc/manganese transport system permease protein